MPETQQLFIPVVEANRELNQNEETVSEGAHCHHMLGKIVHANGSHPRNESVRILNFEFGFGVNLFYSI